MNTIQNTRAATECPRQYSLFFFHDTLHKQPLAHTPTTRTFRVKPHMCRYNESSLAGVQIPSSFQSCRNIPKFLAGTLDGEYNVKKKKRKHKNYINPKMFVRTRGQRTAVLFPALPPVACCASTRSWL